MDGQRGDHDLTVNGTIVDPGAPGQASTGIASGLDFGDAPAPYCTLAEDGGASHSVDEGDTTAPFLSFSSVPTDTEADGQPDPYAMGDDTAYDPDEEGVIIPQLHPGQNAAIVFQVHNGPAFVDGWIDFNGNGLWGDMTQEYVVYGNYSPGIYTTGQNAPSVNVPADALPGNTYARFRINNIAPLPPCNTDFIPAGNGEVEDFSVEITPLPPGTIIIQKQTDPGGAPRQFQFPSQLRFQLFIERWPNP